MPSETDMMYNNYCFLITMIYFYVFKLITSGFRNVISVCTYVYITVCLFACYMYFFSICTEGHLVDWQPELNMSPS